MTPARFARPRARGPSWQLDADTCSYIQRATAAGATQQQMADRLRVSVTAVKQWQQWLSLTSLRRRDAVVRATARHDTCSCGSPKRADARVCRACFRASGGGKGARKRWYRVSLPGATFGLAERDGVIVSEAPIAAWCHGKRIDEVLAYWRKRGASVEELAGEKGAGS